MTATLFAWGEPCADGHSCPAVTAGYSMDDTTVRRVAEMYDMMASHYPRADDNWSEASEGLVDACDARQAWRDTIESLNERQQRGYDETERLHVAALIYRDLWGDD